MKTAGGPLRDAEPGAAQLGLIALGLIDTAADRIRHPALERGEDLHTVRVTVKRLRAILRLIRPVISRRFFERENAHLRRAGRRLAFSRDNSIAVKTLAELAKSVSGAHRRAAIAAAEGGFVKLIVPKAAVDRAMKQVGRDLEESARRMERMRISGSGWEAVQPGLHKVYSQARRRMAEAFEKDDDVFYHRWRIRVKALYYELELFELNAPKRLGKEIKRLNKLEGHLGDNQDIAMLKRTLLKTPKVFGGDGNVEQVIECLNKKSDKLKRKSRKLGEALFAKQDL